MSTINHLWYAIPLVIAFSFCYAGTRNELMRPIIAHALRWIFWFFVISLAMLLFLYWIT